MFSFIKNQIIFLLLNEIAIRLILNEYFIYNLLIKDIIYI